MDASVPSARPELECPDEDAFTALFEHTLPAAEASLLETHVDACARCQSLVGALARMRSDGPGPDTGAAAPGLPGAIGRGISVGRYIVLSTLGAGSMGVVFAAYDPELDRKVALKLLRTDLEDGRRGRTQARILREAQTIARIASPNVIGVYDVGAFEGRVFLAMEFAEGSTLTEWLSADKRDFRDILRVFVAAGRGLAAAHAVGVVHRDFKPDNVLITRSGQVKVADFGLARPDAAEGESRADADGAVWAASEAGLVTVTQSGARVGTPAFMAPEQHRGQRADARSDQFSFSVALYEALVGVRPPRKPSGETEGARALEEALRQKVPGWLASTVARGLRNDASMRHSSMDEFLRVLEVTPRRHALRAAGLAALVGTLAVASAATVFVRARLRGQALLCGGAEDKVAGAWNEDRKHAIEAALDATELPYAAFVGHRVGEVVDAYTSDWSAMRKEACTATRFRGEQSDAMLDLRMACLDRHLEEVRTLADVLEHDAPKVAKRATSAALGLSPLSECTAARLTTGASRIEEAARKAHPEIAGTLDRARVLSRSGDVEESTRLADEGRARAHEAAAQSLEALALVTLGKNRGSLQDWPGSERLYFDAFELAERSGATLTAAEAAAKLGFIDAMLNKTDDAPRWLRLASAAIERAGGDQRLEIALTQIRAATLFMAGDDAAVPASRAALSLAEPAADRFPTLLADALGSYGNAVSVTEDSEAKDAAYERALRIDEKEVGPFHPDTGIVLTNLALTRLDEERYEEALAFAQRALSISERLGPGYGMQASDSVTVGRALTGLRRYQEARSYLGRAFALAESNPSFSKRELAYLYVALGELEDRSNRDGEAARAYERATSLFEEALGKGRPEAAGALLGLGLLRLKEGRALDARKALESSLAASDHGNVVAWQTRFALARALWETGGDRERARRLAQEALDHYGRHPAGHDAVRDLEQWLRDHDALPARRD